MINQVTLAGALGRDPEVRHVANTKVANLSIATSEFWKDKQTGERKQKTEWHRVVVFGALAEVCEKYLAKGSKVFIQGKLQTRKWTDQSGQERYTTEVLVAGPAAMLRNLSAKKDSGDVDEREPEPAAPTTEYSDDDIPF